MMATMSHSTPHTPSSPFAFNVPGSVPTSSTPTPLRKRPAESTPFISPHSDKKRRPNLANGFSGLSISERLNKFGQSSVSGSGSGSGSGPGSPNYLPSYEESQRALRQQDQVDDDDQNTGLCQEGSSTSSQGSTLFGSGSNAYGASGSRPKPRDVNVEELPERSSNSWTRASITSSSTSSTSADENDGDSDSTFRPLRHRRRYARVAQHPDEVEHPDEPFASGSGSKAGMDHPEFGSVRPEVQVEDLSAQSPGRKRRESFGDVEMEKPRRKRRKNIQGGDFDMDTDDERERTGWDDEDTEEIRRTARRRRTQWHEPEKDRIVITSLGESDSEASTPPRSPSPATKARYLSQPGSNGFTLSPSLLTHLLNSPRNDVLPRPAMEKGLVLYRPLPNINAGFSGQDSGSGSGFNNGIVNEWNGDPPIGDDSSRFEEIDDDEELGGNAQESSQGGAEMGMDQDMDMGMGMNMNAESVQAGQGGGDVDMSMDIE